ncbi:MAG: hypothetical protein JW794_00650, partial [Candidatus Cloacimonetes bacterium]|nr:hypothetical protein [Candidatus Cloacimonadota bacterium]
MITVLNEINFKHEVVYWDRTGNGNADDNIHAYRSKSGNKVTKILGWFLFLLKSILNTSACIIQPSNLDSAFIPMLLKTFNKYRIIYDIRDSFAYTLGLKNRFMIGFIRSIDNLFMYFADEILICDEARIQYIKGRKNREKVSIIMNVPQEINVQKDYTKNN